MTAPSTIACKPQENAQNHIESQCELNLQGFLCVDLKEEKKSYSTTYMSSYIEWKGNSEREENQTNCEN